MSYAQKILDFYANLGDVPPVPDAVKVLNPFRDQSNWKLIKAFYEKFYSQDQPRVFLIGINPGRHGAGTTGIPFTDPIRLNKVCGINNSFPQRPELSSKFIYRLIDSCGGVEPFYHHFYFTSVSPYGFTKNGKNLNYYDHKGLQKAWEPFMVQSLKDQIDFGCNQIAYSLGKGKNLKYLLKMNSQYQLFKEIRPLPHPRWVMQYRLKIMDEFVELYRKQLTPYMVGEGEN